MKKHLQTVLVLFISFLVFPNSVFGADNTNQLTNLTLTYKSGELNDIYLNWDDSKIENEIEGYAIQWSDKISDIRNDKYAKLTSATSDRLMRLRPKRDQWYYFRVYTYKLNGRKKILSDGSKMIKWKRTSGLASEKEELTVTDVDITTTNSSDTNDTSSTSFNFGTIGIMSLDTFADFKWSHQSKMASSDYDGFYITIAKKSDLTDIVKTFKTNRNKFTARLKGLTPDTQYYVRGAFYKTINGKDSIFGTGSETKIKAFKTIKAIDRSISNRVTRNLKKLERKPCFTIEVGVDDEIKDDTINSEKKKETTSNNSGNSVTKRIIAIKAQIKRLEAELAKLQGKKIAKNTEKTYTKIKERKSFREIIRERLAARRAAKK